MMALNGSLNVGAYGVLVFLTQRLLWPLTGLAQVIDLFERAMANTKRILDLLEVPITVKDDSTTPLTAPVRRRAFERDFQYDSQVGVNGVDCTFRWQYAGAGGGHRLG